MSLRFLAGATLGTIFAVAATPVTLVPAIGVGVVTGATTWAGGAIGKWGGLAFGGLFGAAAGGALTKDAEVAAGGGAILGAVSFVLGAIAGPIVGGVLGYNAGVDYFSEPEQQDTTSIQYEVGSHENPMLAEYKTEDGNYALPAQKLAA